MLSGLLHCNIMFIGLLHCGTVFIGFIHHYLFVFVYYIVILCFLVLLHYDSLIISCGIFSLSACGLHMFVRERTYVDGRYHSRTFMSVTNIGTTCLQL